MIMEVEQAKPGKIVLEYGKPVDGVESANKNLRNFNNGFHPLRHQGLMHMQNMPVGIIPRRGGAG